MIIGKSVSDETYNVCEINIRKCYRKEMVKTLSAGLFAKVARIILRRFNLSNQ